MTNNYCLLLDVGVRLDGGVGARLEVASAQHAPHTRMQIGGVGAVQASNKLIGVRLLYLFQRLPLGFDDVGLHKDH